MPFNNDIGQKSTLVFQQVRQTNKTKLLTKAKFWFDVILDAGLSVQRQTDIYIFVSYFLHSLWYRWREIYIHGQTEENFESTKVYLILRYFGQFPVIFLMATSLKISLSQNDKNVL